MTVISACVIPVFAFGTNVPDANYVYYKYWQLGGEQAYNEVRQCVLTDGRMTKGNETYMQALGKKLKMSSAVKFETFKDIPSSVAPASTVTVKESLLYNSGFLTWTPVVFSDGSTLHTIENTYKVSTRAGSGSTYNAVPITTKDGQKSGDYQIDLVVTTIPKAYQSYITLWYQSGIDKV